MSSKFIAAAVVVALIGVGVVAYVSNRPAKVAELPEAVNSIKSDDTSQPKPAVVAPKISQVLGLGDEDFVRVGDVKSTQTRY
jgi:predicted transcriptional regulator